MKTLRSIICAVLAVLAMAAFTTSCTPGKNPPPPKYFFAFMDSIFKNTKNPVASIGVVDSLYRVHPSASVDCKFEFYGDAIYIYYFLEKNYSKAMAYADSQLLLVRNNPGISNYYKLYSDANISKGDILFNLGDYDGAFGYLFQAKIAAEKSMDPCAYYLLSYRLGMVMYKTNRFADAAAYFKQAFGEPEGCGEKFGTFYKLQGILNYTALCYNNIHMLDSALLYSTKARGYVATNGKQFTNPKQRIKIDVALGIIYGTTAKAYANTNYHRAEEMYKKSIDINSRPGYDAGDALQNEVGLARLYYENRNMPVLLTTLQNIAICVDTLKNPHVLTEMAQLEWEYYNYVKDTAKAYTWVLQYNKFKAAEDTANGKLNKADVITQIKSLETEYQLSLLTKENKLKQFYLAGTLLLFIMAVVIVLLLLRNWQKARKNLHILDELHNKVQLQKNELQDALEELETRSNEKDRIMGILAHDLRNPIAGISSLVELVLAEQQYGKEALEPIFTLIQNACSNSLALVNETLEFAVYGSGGYHTEAQLIDINLIAANCVRMMQFKALEKKQQLRLINSGTPEIVLADPAKMWRVISNLITNAVKFSPAGRKIEINTWHVENTVQIAIKDEGIGIPDTIKNRIFDAHTPAKRLGTNGEKPFGIGLSICKQIVEACDGNIWFESEAGKGTTFYISLPRQNISPE
jgi:signal transduction histidine kinase